MTEIELMPSEKLMRLKPRIRDTLHTYNKWKRYDSDLNEVMGYVGPQVMAQHLLPYVKKGYKLLDVGCGTGINGSYYKNCTLAGIDISNKSLERAKEKNIYSVLKQGNVEEGLNFDDESFDVVFCVGLFEYFKKIEPLVKEMARVSKNIVAFNATTTKPPYLFGHDKREVIKALNVSNLELLDEFRAHTWNSEYRGGTKRIFTRGIVSKKK